MYATCHAAGPEPFGAGLQTAGLQTQCNPDCDDGSMSSTVIVAPSTVDVRAVQRRTLGVLVLSQVVGGVGVAIGALAMLHI